MGGLTVLAKSLVDREKTGQVRQKPQSAEVSHQCVQTYP